VHRILSAAIGTGIATVTLLGLACAGCSTSSMAAIPPTPASPATPRTTTAPVTTAPSTLEQASCAAQVYARLTEPERVGQLFLVGTTGSADNPQIKAHHFGSALLSGNSTAGIKRIREETSAIAGLAGNGVRFFIAANQEGGEIQPLKGPGFETMPSALAQGSMTPKNLQRQAQTWGRELRQAGVNLNLAPVLDVVPPGTASTNAPIGELDREYGSNASTVAVHGVAFIRGMQAAGVATTAKHFPGLGRVRGNTDFTANVVDKVTTTKDLASYQAGINAGVPFLMVALATYTRIDPHHLAVFSSRIVTGVLRDQLRFTGVIISDDLGEAAAVASVAPGTRAIDFLNAGGDMITSQDIGPAVTMEAAVLHRVADDAAFRGRVTTAVLKILAAKAKYGLLACSPS
jgi:beta-N-acetylhexosaminidase